MSSNEHGTDTASSTLAALRADSPQQNMRLVTKSFEPSAGYIGKKTLNKKRATLSCTALPTRDHPNAGHFPTLYQTRTLSNDESGFNAATKACQALS
mmetsp:Transcript_120344/g.208877  ORF Transcript_120344/g.208877 Transcript_120344/m.208877 type:complete len:97 (-) Transcript_120344:176-466(-)